MMRFLNPKMDFAFKIANKCGLSPAALDAQERREIFIQGQRGAIALAEQRGEQRERLRIAESSLDLIEDDALIAARTSLPVETVRVLRRRDADGSE